MSGPNAFDLAQSIAGRLPPPRQASLCALRSPDGLLLDRALVLRFEAASSATGEDLVELHCHGGRAVVAAVEQVLVSDSRARPAVPGEFTRRALANGRIDLAQARGLADLLEAETETQRRYAIMASDGHLSRMVTTWIDRLADFAADVEAVIDYGEEGDVLVQAPSLQTVVDRGRTLMGEIEVVLAAPPVERWRDGIRVVLAGPPNSGKSTLLNLLAGREAAIVSPTAGTTRDQIDVSVKRDGVAYVLSDTAGLREQTGDAIEILGMAKARTAIEVADLVLWLGDEVPPASTMLHVHARADMPGRSHPPSGAVRTSASDIRTIANLWTTIALRTRKRPTSGPALHAEERRHCEVCVRELRSLHDDLGEEFVAAKLQTAARALSSIIGTDVTEIMLDRLFARFCVGK